MKSVDLHVSSPSLGLEDSSESPKFPPEIFDLILRNIYDDIQENINRDTLIACSAVSRSFIHLSRQYLFRQISIFQNQDIKSFLDFLDSSLSTITFHIRIVKLEGWCARELDSISVRRLLAFPNVTMLHMSCMRWEVLPEETRSFLSSSLPKLTVLRLHLVQFPTLSSFLEFLHACPGLQGLELCITNVAENEDASVPLPDSMSLKRLHISRGDVGIGTYWLDWLLLSPNRWCLESLKLSFLGKQEMDKAWQFVQTLRSSLKHLVVFFTLHPFQWPQDAGMLFVQTFRLNDFVHLRSIEVSISTAEVVNFDDFLVPLLSMLPDSIRIIKVHFLMDKDSELENIDWRTFISLFRTPQLSVLECIQICMGHRRGHTEGTRKIGAMVRDRLEKYRASGIFLVSSLAEWGSDLL